MKYIVQSVDEKIPGGVTRVAPFMSEWAANWAKDNNPENYVFVTPERARIDMYAGYLVIPVEE